MTRLAGKVALVTGASRGIGAGIARRLAAEGAAVVVHHNDDAQNATRVVADIVWRGGRAITVQGEVAHWPDVRRLFEEIVMTFGGLDILVNNAGMTTPLPQRAITDDDAWRPFESHLFGAMLMCHEAVRLFGADGGSIINLTALERCDMAPRAASELAPDAAVDTLTLGLSRAFGPRHIRVRSVALGLAAVEETAAINVLDGSTVNPCFLAMPSVGRARAPILVAEAAISLACHDDAFRSTERIVIAGG